jgi:hypothetical protein
MSHPTSLSLSRHHFHHELSIESQIFSRPQIFIPPELIIKIGKHATLDTLASMCRASTEWNGLLTSVLHKKGVKASETNSTEHHPAWRAFMDYQVLTFGYSLIMIFLSQIAGASARTHAINQR